MTPQKVSSWKLVTLPTCFFAIILSGCGSGSVATSTGNASRLILTGHVNGGQQPVAYSTVQLWAAGTGGNGSAATPMVPAGSYFPGGAPNCNPANNSCSSSVITDASGNFTLTGDYTCTHTTDQVYISSTGGNPGLASGTNNGALLLLAALGSCGNLSASTHIDIDEITTVAAAWALAPFMDQKGNIGASATNTVGIANAFLNAQLLADSATGLAATLPGNLTVETGKLYAFANSIASCVNSDGTSGCQPLFAAATPATGTAPTNTLGAALNVVRNPANHVAAVFNSSSPIPPFPSSLSAPPGDWTMSLTVSGGGVYFPTALAVDSFGNVWAGGYYGVLSAFSPQGTPRSSSGFGVGTLSEVYGLAIDISNNIWVSNEESPHHGNFGSVTKFLGASSGAALGTLANGTQYLYSSFTDYPDAIAADTNGDMLVSNYGNATATVFNSSGSAILDGVGNSANGGLAFPKAVSFDATHGLWVANEGDQTIAHFDATGTLLGRPQCCNGASGIATDAFGNAWVASYNDSSISEVSNANSILIQTDQQGGVTNPSGIVVDAGQNVWVTNYRGASFSEFAGNRNVLPAGTGISPSSGYGVDAKLVEPYGIAVDASGNLWVSNFNGSTLSMFFGIATPTATPAMSVPAAP
jgi:hypothetical protein